MGVPNAEAAATLRSVKVPPAMTRSRAFVDLLLDHAENGVSDDLAVLGSILDGLTNSHVEVIGVLGNMEDALKKLGAQPA